MVSAYIDPGSGSLSVQMLVAAALAIPWFLREHNRRVIWGGQSPSALR